MYRCPISHEICNTAVFDYPHKGVIFSVLSSASVSKSRDRITAMLCKQQQSLPGRKIAVYLCSGDILLLLLFSAVAAAFKDILLNTLVQPFWTFCFAYFMYSVALLATLTCMQHQHLGLTSSLRQNSSCDFLSSVANPGSRVSRVLLLIRHVTIVELNNFLLGFSTWKLL